MSSFPNDPFLIYKRKGDKTDPFLQYYEPKTVSNGKVILTELPDKGNHVNVDDGTNTYAEITSQTSLSASNVYYVDYDRGIVYFDASKEGLKLNFKYLGIGGSYVPATRVYTQSSNGTVTQDVQDMIDNYNQLNGTDLYNLFDPQTGHKHTGASGDAPPIDSQYVNYSGNGVVSTSNVKDTLDSHAAQLAENANPAHNQGGLIFGQEYLSHFHKKIMSFDYGGTTKLNMVFSGDSTTAGDSTTSSVFHVDQLLEDYARKHGLSIVKGINNGQSGKDTEHWNQTYVNNDLSANPDLLVLRWGINDPYYAHADNSMLPDQSTDNPSIDALRRTPEDFNNSLRSGLQKIRSQFDYQNLSIVLMAPSSTYDIPNGRYSVWYESIIPYIKQAARDFQCVFINTYQFLYDSQNAMDNMDNPYGDGRHIHPNDVRNLWITSLMCDTIFPSSFLNNVQTNHMINDWSGDVVKSVNDLPNTYPKGLSVYRSTDAPIDGSLITFYSTDGVLFQINHGYSTTTDNGFQSRIGFASIDGTQNTWSTWNTNGNQLENVQSPTLQNGWVNYDPTNGRNAGYYKDPFGIVHLQGLIKSGTPTAGTTLFVLPTGYIPSKGAFFPVTSNNAFGSISIDTVGTVCIQAGSNTWLSLDGVSFRP